MVIKISAKQAKSLRSMVIGLLGSSKPEPLLLKTRFGIHTFGMKYPIEAVVLDSNSQIKKMVLLKINRIFIWNPAFPMVLELPQGSIKRLNLKKGDLIRIN